MSRGRKALWWGLLALACALGLFLRVWQLPQQMLLDDEWHAVRKLLETGYADIATHFGRADYCIPLTLYYRWRFEHGALNEWQMHLPLLLAGSAALVVLPWLLRRDLSLPVRTVWTALLAISPALIYFSRTARPYALVGLLGPLAIVALRNWQRAPHTWRRWLPIYVVATGFAGWLHLLSLPFTLWPLAFYGARAMRDLFTPMRAQAWKNLAALFAVGVCVALALAVELAPPLLHDWASMRVKASTDSVTPQSLLWTLRLAFGVGQTWLCAALAVVLLAGIARLWRRDREFVALVLSGSGVGIVAICLARPAWIQHGPVLLRYAVAVLPFVLLFVAEGIVALAERIAASWSAMPAGIAVAALVALGPLPAWYYWPNQFMGSQFFQFDFDYADQDNPFVRLAPTTRSGSAFYRQLASFAPGSLTLIEAPRRAESDGSDLIEQREHRQYIEHALVGEVCGANDWDIVAALHGARFRWLVDLRDVLDGQRHRGDYLVLDLVPLRMVPGRLVQWPDMPACVEKVAARLGAPVFRDEKIVVFALTDRARAALHPQ